MLYNGQILRRCKYIKKKQYSDVLRNACHWKLLHPSRSHTVFQILLLLNYCSTGLQFFPNWVDEDWKQRADRITREDVLAGTGTSQKLLTDASSVPKSRQRGRHKKQQQQAQKIVELVHMCSGGKCR